MIEPHTWIMIACARLCGLISALDKQDRRRLIALMILGLLICPLAWIAYEYWRRVDDGLVGTAVLAYLPLAFMTAFMAAFVGRLVGEITYAFMPWKRALDRLDRGLCVECGYGLRASTGSCPECGHAEESK